MNIEDLLLTGIFLLFAIRFLLLNRRELNRSSFVRHTIFMAFVYTGCLSFLHGDKIVRAVFGKEIYKGDPQELIAGPLPILVCLFFFGLAAISLGKNRARHFKLYIKTFGFKKPHAPD